MKDSTKYELMDFLDDVAIHGKNIETKEIKQWKTKSGERKKTIADEARRIKLMLLKLRD